MKITNIIKHECNFLLKVKMSLTYLLPVYKYLLLYFYNLILNYCSHERESGMTWALYIETIKTEHDYFVQTEYFVKFKLNRTINGFINTKVCIKTCIFARSPEWARWRTWHCVHCVHCLQCQPFTLYVTFIYTLIITYNNYAHTHTQSNKVFHL